jgi:uracil-DNA glycosylase family 4
MHAEICADCPYRDNGLAFKGMGVGPKGDPRAEFVIIGEAPGADEMKEGVPFVGPSGRMLDSTLKKAGWRDGDPIFITNALRCRPHDTPPKKEAIKACQSRLHSEISQHPRRVVLSLGGIAAQSLTGKFGLKITQERGKVIEPETLGGIKVVLGLHPAYILRNQSAFKFLANDIQYAVGLYNETGTVRDPGVTQWTVADTAEKVKRFVKALLKYKLLSSDIETDGFNPRKNVILSIAVSWEKNKVVVFPDSMLQDPVAFKYIKKLFENKGPKFVWHNGKFDIKFLHYIGINARTDEDTMLMHYSLNEIKGTHDLKQLSQIFLGVKEDYSKILKKYLPKKSTPFSVVPRKVLYKYQAWDADYTLQLWHLFNPMIDAEPGLRRLYSGLLIPASRFLTRVEERGILIDRNNLETLKKTLETQLARALQQIERAVVDIWNANEYTIDVGAKKVPQSFNPSSPKQVGWILYTKMKLKPKKGFKKNTAAPTLATLPPNAFIAAMLRLRKVEKQLGTYVYGVEDVIEEDGRVHATYLIHGTITGRLSSRGPNLQNQPRSAVVRDEFTAGEGRVFVEFDYSGAELRVLALLSGDEKLKEVFINGRDLHDEVSRAIWGPNFTSEQRMRAKAVNFGIVYGREAQSLAMEFGIPMREAQEWIDVWFQTYKKAHEYILSCKEAAAKGTPLISPFGRHKRFGLVNTANLHTLQNQASNFNPQNTASDLTLISAFTAYPELPRRDMWIENLVHDSILVNVPNNREAINFIFQFIRDTMVNTPVRTLKSDVPFNVDAKIGTHWGTMEKMKKPIETDIWEPAPREEVVA